MEINHKGEINENMFLKGIFRKKKKSQLWFINYMIVSLQLCLLKIKNRSTARKKCSLSENSIPRLKEMQLSDFNSKLQWFSHNRAVLSSNKGTLQSSVVFTNRL